MYIISGKYKNCKLITPKGLVTRPTSGRMREALFNICQHIVEDATFLDLFAGSGAMGLEALSRGAKKVTLVDSGKESVKCIKKNIDLMGVRKGTEVYATDVFTYLKKMKLSERQFDIIYIDPPYSKNLEEGEKGIGQQVVEEIDCLDLLSPSGILFVEEAKKALQANTNLATLSLKKERSYGRSSLYQYERKESQ